MSKNEKKSRYIFIYATFPSKKSALKATEKLIQKKLAVCANIRKHDAVYVWEGRLYKEKEFGALFKTREDKWKKAEKFILKKHPYETPVILRLEINDSNVGFKKWVDGGLD